MAGDSKVRVHTSSIGTQMTWLAVALKCYNTVVWLSFAGSASVHRSEKQCRSNVVDLQWDRKKSINE